MQPQIRFPAAWEPHACCLMAWAVHPEWRDWVAHVKTELAAVIETIARFEPVRLLTPSDQIADARARFAGADVEIVEAPVDDVWMRDIAPVFAWRGDEIVAVDLSFNGWGDTRARRRRAGDALAQHAAHLFGVPRVRAPFVGEGGALIADGEGTVITTRSCLLNPNRNGHIAALERQRRIEHELQAFEIQRVIWLEGDPCEPVTGGHVDSYVLFAAPGKVLVESVDDADNEAPLWRDHDVALLQQMVDAAGRRLQVERVCAPRKRYWRYRGRYWAPCYLNAYLANGAVITARFGDPERDEAAKRALAVAFPGRDIVMLRIDHIAAGGGGVHCLTQEMGRLSGG